MQRGVFFPHQGGEFFEFLALVGVGQFCLSQMFGSINLTMVKPTAGVAYVVL